MLAAPPAYTVLLAANAKGRELLAQARKSADIPIITKPADFEKHGDDVKKAFLLARKAASVRALSLDAPASVGDIMRKGPYVER